MSTRSAQLIARSVLAFVLLTSVCLAAQATQSSVRDSELQKHYEAAQSTQSAGDLDQAAVEYKAFLSEALHRIADRRAQAGDFTKACEFFEQALALAPNDANLLLDYAEAQRAANNLVKAQAAAESTLQTDPNNARASFVLGQILLRRKEYERAQQLLEASVQREPTFEHGYALGVSYLAFKDPKHAATIFGEMITGFGDTATIHMEFGRAFAEAGYPEQGIDEFKKAVAKDDKLAGAHYSLGAAYLVGLADAAFPEASEEFQKELKNHPDDVLSLYQLGYIALSQHKLDEAENYLGRTATLDPTNPDVPLSLGQAYAEQNRQAEAETFLRKSIVLTKDVSRNHYQVQRAHYLLGRLLLQAGKRDEAKEELKIADQLMKLSVVDNQGQTAGSQLNDVSPSIPLRSTSLPVDPENLKQVEAYEQQLSPAIADSYNNLGAIAAGGSQFSSALDFFQQAAVWNPSLETLDYNWGKAAFSANQYAQAIAPLGRYLHSHSNDTLIRSALGSSLFNVKEYREAVETLRPLQDLISSNSRLDFIYSVSLVKTGAVTEGLARLLALEKAMPRLADIHTALGETYSAQGNETSAAQELRSAIELNPSDANTKRQLAMSLVKLRQKEEAETLFAALVRQGSQDADVYRELGKLQLEKDEIKAAIANFESGAKLDPGSQSIHYELANAYRRDSRTEDADREMKLYETLRAADSSANNHH